MQEIIELLQSVSGIFGHLQMDTLDTVANTIKQIADTAVTDTSENAAALIEFLLSRDAAYITGQTIHVDGGLTLA